MTEPTFTMLPAGGARGSPAAPPWCKAHDAEHVGVQHVVELLADRRVSSNSAGRANALHCSRGRRGVRLRRGRVREPATESSSMTSSTSGRAPRRRPLRRGDQLGGQIESPRTVPYVMWPSWARRTAVAGRSIVGSGDDSGSHGRSSRIHGWRGRRDGASAAAAARPPARIVEVEGFGTTKLGSRKAARVPPGGGPGAGPGRCRRTGWPTSCGATTEAARPGDQLSVLASRLGACSAPIASSAGGGSAAGSGPESFDLDEVEALAADAHERLLAGSPRRPGHQPPRRCGSHAASCCRRGRRRVVGGRPASRGPAGEPARRRCRRRRELDGGHAVAAAGLAERGSTTIPTTRRPCACSMRPSRGLRPPGIGPRGLRRGPAPAPRRPRGQPHRRDRSTARRAAGRDRRRRHDAVRFRFR